MIRLTVKEKVGYSLGDAACHIVFDNVMFYMMFFYTDIYGISAAFVGTLFLVARVLDAVADPIIGIVADRTRTRWGKFRPYILWGAVPFGIICTLTYWTPPLGESGRLVYASVTYLLLTLIFTVVNVPYCSLGDVITPDPAQRISLQSWRFVISGISGMLSTVMLLPLAHWIGGPGNLALGYGGGMAVLSAVAVVLLLLSFAWTKERLSVNDFSGDVMHDVRLLCSNRPWLMVMGLSILNIMQWSMRGGAMIYYVTYFVGDAALFTAFLATYSVGSILGVGLAKPLVDRFCKVNVFAGLNALLGVTSVLLFFIPPQATAAMFVFSFVLGVMHQMMTPIQWVMISDAVDYGEWKDGRRLTGISFAGILFASKLGLAFSGAIIGWTLSGAGYVANATASSQSPAALTAILGLFTLGPAALYFASAAATRLYPLKGQHFSTVCRDLEQRRTVPVSADPSGSLQPS